MVKYRLAGKGTDDIITVRMRILCCIPKATNTHCQYVILIASPLQQWLHDRTALLRYTYIACLAGVYLGTLTVRGLPSGNGKYTSEQPVVKDVEGSGRGRV